MFRFCFAVCFWMSWARCFFVGWFFFSSRRRHTRLQGDWSSDVCSSDLSLRRPVVPQCRHLRDDGGRRLRSQERRVGKECRSLWLEDNSKKKNNKRK